MRKLLAALLLATLSVACTDQPTAPDRQGVTPGPTLNTVFNSVQQDWPIRVTWLDSDTDWDVLLLGYDPADDMACNGGVFVGGITVRGHLVISQETFPFGTRDQYSVHTIGRPPLYMYLRADFPPPGATDAEWCTFFKEGWAAAGGWSATLAADNDLSGFDGTPGINSWGGTEAGTLLGTDGTRYIYSWKYKAHCDPDVGCWTMHSVDRVRRVGN